MDIYDFNMPEKFSNDGTNFIPEEKVAQKLKLRDEFTCGHEIVLAGKSVDESAEQYLFERETGVDTRERVSISKRKDNFVVVIEGVHNGKMSVGSGVLAQIK
jgi:hypothetical protein